MDHIIVYASGFVMFSLLAAGGFTVPAGFADNDQVFARCVVCHIENAETTKTSPHNQMACIECHIISDFGTETHNATIPVCSSCHENISPGLQHKKSRFSQDKYSDNKQVVPSRINVTYIMDINPVNADIKT